MTPEEIRAMRSTNFKQTNAYAMQNGLILGAFSILTQISFLLGLSTPFFSTLHLILFINIPVLACFLTARFRRTVAPNFPFSFSRGFGHTLLTMLYAGIWAGVAVFVYMYFFDKGYVFDRYAEIFSRPEIVQELDKSGMTEQIKQMSGGKTLSQMIDQFRVVPPSSYAGFIIYFYLLSAPLVAILGGLFNIRRNTLRKF